MITASGNQAKGSTRKPIVGINEVNAIAARPVNMAIGTSGRMNAFANGATSESVPKAPTMTGSVKSSIVIVVRKSAAALPYQ